MIFEKVCSLSAAQLAWKDSRPYSLEFQDHYFSQAGGLEEAAHVFVQGNGLDQRFQQLPLLNSYFVIGEIGFGAGRNFLLTLEHFLTQAPKTARLQYLAFESHPLSPQDLISILALWPTLTHARFLIESYPPLVPGLHKLSFAEDRVTLYLYFGEAYSSLESLLLCGEGILENQLRPQSVDAWYLDGFSPARNPNAWSLSLLTFIAKLSHHGSTCSTYSAAGRVRRDLETAGFIVEKKPGFALKREMLCGVLRAYPTSKPQYTPWYRSQSRSYINDKAVIILGAGLAGCYMAYELAQRGWRVKLIEQYPQVAAGASKHSQALLFPGIFQINSPLATLLQTAYLYSKQQLKLWEKNAKAAKQTGLLYFPYQKKITGINALAYRVNSVAASQIAGVPILEEGWYLPDSGIVNIPKLCQWLISHSSISLSTQQTISKITHESGQWQVGENQAPVLVLANGIGMMQFSQCDYLSLYPVRGQITWIEASENSASLGVPLCGSGHVLPAEDRMHSLGATYERNQPISRLVDDDDVSNLSILNKIPVKVSWLEQVMQRWAGVRTVTGDYFPCVGQLANAALFFQQYASLKTDSKRFIPKGAESYPGLYVFSGFGSKGLTTIPLLASALAEEINGGMVYLPRSLLKGVSPNRFLFKMMVKG